MESRNGGKIQTMRGPRNEKNEEDERKCQEFLLGDVWLNQLDIGLIYYEGKRRFGRKGNQ